MTFVLVELEDLDALGRVAVSGSGPSKADLDRGWNESFLGMYFWVRTGTNADGATTLRTRMIERTIEDPATGSAASDLAAYLSLADEKQETVFDYAITQGVEMGRRSDINLRVVVGGSGVERIILGGSAIPVMQGRLTVED
ncbi:unnamed protein product [Periconia digitata]|uniref:Uncharacterized protein n=1 Tax=Periconia digitata TaxID=1303443 RepID=A0A9W4UH70_9PLEO|nr:unnamed protein product [Periconia digitata]